MTSFLNRTALQLDLLATLLLMPVMLKPSFQQRLPSSISSISWLSMSYPSRHIVAISNVSVGDIDRRPLTNPSSSTDCVDHMYGLSGQQKQLLCRRHHLPLIDAVRQAALSTLDECRHQFNRERWNCPIEVAARRRRQRTYRLLNVPVEGSREFGFVQALSAAVLAHSITRHCSSGQLASCGCDQTVTSADLMHHYSTSATAQAAAMNLELVSESSTSLSWSGCSENIGYGSAFSRVFLELAESIERPRRRRANSTTTYYFSDTPTAATDDDDAVAAAAAHTEVVEPHLVNLHNGEVGRQVFQANRRILCKCHGMSGSCNLRTCWQAAPSLRHLSDSLKQRYIEAIQVKQQQLVTPNATNTVPASFLSATMSPLVLMPESNLIYIRASPDYCHATVGRQCGPEIADCERLCCGRSHVTRKRVFHDSRCRCHFNYCCHVTCESCEKLIKEQFCM